MNNNVKGIEGTSICRFRCTLKSNIHHDMYVRLGVHGCRCTKFECDKAPAHHYSRTALQNR